VLHLRSLANWSRKPAIDKKELETLVVDPYFVPEGTPLSTQLLQFQKAKQRFALVVDEYGDIQGIVTLEDILEEIVGEFTTDPASDDQEIIRDGENAFLVDGGVNIRELNRSMNWKLPTAGPKTLNGLILEYLETIPESGATLNIEGYPIEIVKTTENRVKTARIRSGT
jgi:Mg2+/Co2+ transporter CorB